MAEILALAAAGFVVHFIAVARWAFPRENPGQALLAVVTLASLFAVFFTFEYASGRIGVQAIFGVLAFVNGYLAGLLLFLWMSDHAWGERFLEKPEWARPPEQPQPSSAVNETILFISFWVVMLVMAFIAVFAPADVAGYPGIRQYTDASRALIPGIDQLARVSSFPGATVLVVSLMWTLVPLLAIFYFFHIEIEEGWWRQFRRNRFFMTFAMLLVAGSVVSIAVMYEIDPRELEPGRRRNVLRLVSTYRLGLGLVAGFFAVGLALMVCVVARWLAGLRRIFG
jgi:hypothetical protein